MKNHEIRLKVNYETYSKIKNLHKTYASHIRLPEFCRIIFDLGLRELETNLSKGLFPHIKIYFYNEKQTKKSIKKPLVC